MTVQYASDLHLEMPVNRAWMELNPLVPKADVLILAGDILYLRDEHYTFKLLDIWSSEFEQVYIVPGNHEFYGRSFPLKETFPSFRLPIRRNVTYLNNQSITIENVRFIFSTLFTHIKYPEVIVNRMNDFHTIHYEADSLLSLEVSQYNECHDNCVAYLEKELSSHSGKQVVISHHAPYPGELIDFPFETSRGEAYHVDLLDLCDRHKVSHWISGHTHINKGSFEVGGTSFHSNQLGYVYQDQHHDFKRDAIVDIN